MFFKLNCNKKYSTLSKSIHEIAFISLFSRLATLKNCILISVTIQIYNKVSYFIIRKDHWKSIYQMQRILRLSNHKGT
jgi:hypothetical protein